MSTNTVPDGVVPAVSDRVAAIAEALADAVFTNGAGQTADRLVLETQALRINLGGWSRDGFISQVTKVLAASGSTQALAAADSPTAIAAEMTEWLSVGGFFNPEQTSPVKADGTNAILGWRNRLQALAAAGELPASLAGKTPFAALFGALADDESDAPVPAPTETPDELLDALGPVSCVCRECGGYGRVPAPPEAGFQTPEENRRQRLRRLGRLPAPTEGPVYSGFSSGIDKP